MPSGSLRRVVVPAADAPAAPAQLSAYELQRAARIAQNQAALAALGVKHAAAACAAPAVWRRTKPGAADGAERRAKRQAPAEAAGPARSSKRIQVRAGLAEPEPDGASAHAPDELAEPDDVGRLLSVDEYLERNSLPKGPLMSGHFSGWVEDGVRKQLGLGASAAEAWETEGGGKFERRPPRGESAKEFARGMLRKNPNAYFYRHNVPGEDTWHGEWSEEEVALFVKVALEHGCGDKWGLFASYIPHRVGYQCSAAYRHIIIPRGLLRDNHFLMTPRGEAVWVGGRAEGK